MFSAISNIPSTTTVLSTYTTFAASAMLARTVLNELQSLTNHLVPQQLRNKLIAKLGTLIGNLSSHEITLTIDEYCNAGSSIVNEIYQASDTYLSTKITPSNENLRATKTARETQVSVTVNKGEKIVDEFDGVRLTWEYVSTESSNKSYYDYEAGDQLITEKSEKKTYRLRFHKQFVETVVRAYLPYVIEAVKAIDEEKKVVKLMSLGNFGEYESAGPWRSVEFRHPSTFETLAMDEGAKRELLEDLDRFVKRREFYKRIGKAWKRGYLLYGPPGTGKSSLIAAMANYLRFNIYDLELTQLQGNSDFRSLLVSTANQSILVIEDIDCSVELENRASEGYGDSDSKFTLSGLLNFIDGLWSSCGDERIIVFTTNYKDKLDPALLRPGRMDMHIHMSYCTPCGFKTIAFNYLQIRTHRLFGEIEEMLKEVEATPAEVTEELMRSDNADEALEWLVESLRQKKKRRLGEQVSVIDEDETKEEDKERENLEGKSVQKEGVKRRRGRGKRGRY